MAINAAGGLNAAERILELAAIGHYSGNQYASLVNTYPVRVSTSKQCVTLRIFGRLKEY